MQWRQCPGASAVCNQSSCSRIDAGTVADALLLPIPSGIPCQASQHAQPAASGPCIKLAMHMAHPAAMQMPPSLHRLAWRG